MTNSYSGDPASSSKDAVRFWTGDTSAPWLLSDEEINYTLTSYPSTQRAAAACLRKVAASYARKPSRSVGDLSISYSDMAKQYAAAADALEAQANANDATGALPYSGGISVSDMEGVDSNTDRVKPPFRNRQFDNPRTLGSDQDRPAGNNLENEYDP